MSKLRHNNVVMLYGGSTVPPRLAIVTECVVFALAVDDAVFSSDNTKMTVAALQVRSEGQSVGHAATSAG
jgi:hypothetical protein